MESVSVSVLMNVVPADDDDADIAPDGDIRSVPILSDEDIFGGFELFFCHFVDERELGFDLIAMFNANGSDVFGGAIADDTLHESVYFWFFLSFDKEVCCV